VRVSEPVDPRRLGDAADRGAVRGRVGHGSKTRWRGRRSGAPAAQRSLLSRPGLMHPLDPFWLMRLA
jgi:hypothetical protein